MWADVSVQTKIFDASSQPPIVGGVINGFSEDAIVKKGIIVSVSNDNLIYGEQSETTNPYFYEDLRIINDTYSVLTAKDLRIIDCINIGKEQFWCPLLLLNPEKIYYVRAYAIKADGSIIYGQTESLTTQKYNRYNGRTDVANVWHAFDYTLFDLITDEIINPNDGFYYSTNENPTTIRHQIGTGYNTCYKFATEWNYKLWYYHSGHSDANKHINVPIASFSNGKITIEKNPLDVDKDVTIYYSINGNYFRPENYTAVYSQPLSITKPCAVYYYAISSDGYISYTNIYIIDDDTIKSGDDNYSDFGTVADVVDLGLSVKWASWNVGADKPEGLGNLYAWGELYPKTDYSTSTYKFYSGGYKKYGSVDNKYQLDSVDDVAQQMWGDKWRIPTIEELKELKENCTFTKTELNGVPVTKVTGPNGNFIYFPYSGNFTGKTLYYENYIGSYWSSDLESDSYAKDLDFLSGLPDLNGDSRYHGQSVRPVYVEYAGDTYGKVPDIVDLGLSSGTLWASWNLGASSPEEYGAYFAWGETVPKDNYNWSTYKFGNEYNLTKYNSIDGLAELELEDDAANAILGKDWRMPTHKEELELLNECSWESEELNGISGYKVTGPNGNSIFLPRGGLYDGTDYDCDGTTISYVNTCGWYWSSTLNSVGSAYAQGLCFFPSLLTNVIDHERSDGHNIRPVYIRRLTPIDDNGDVDYGNGDIDRNTDLNGNVIGNFYYNISDENGEYSFTEGCITLRKSTSDSDMNNMEGQDIFGEDFRNGFTGIVFMLQAGQGTIKINVESVGNMALKVKIGGNAPMTFELEGKMKASIPYSVTESTYVYIYGGDTSTANARGLGADSDNALKIYGIEWSDEVTGIESICKNVETRVGMYNLNGQRIERPSKGIYIKNGKKIIMK